MSRSSLALALFASWSCLLMGDASAVGIDLPLSRNAYQVDESIEIAIRDLEEGAKASITIAPAEAGPSVIEFEVLGDGSTVTYRLPPFALAPGAYTIQAEGAAFRKLTITRGVHRSTMYVSQTMGAQQLAKSGGNFALSNAFSFGLLDRDRQAAMDLSRLSSGMSAQEGLVAADYPSLIYMYWTGYVLHKPWGIHKEWCSADLTENMRIFNFHVAQRLRRYAGNILLVGSLDEPGLPWGRTAAGGEATGFPGWNTKEWYGARGWELTDDPGSRPNEDWLKYMKIRCAMLGEQCAQASKDLKTVWPEVIYSTDLYAPHAIMDGTEPLNQRCNDVPSTHVFVDWGYGKIGAMSGLYVEKAHDPTAKVAHAMNGQLFSARVPQPQMRYAYHLMLNSLMAAGLYSNWWLNYGGMSPDDLKAVNEPAQRIGPLFVEMGTSGHDVAVLWSFNELALRCKDITSREAKKKSGEQIKLMIADYPETAELEGGEMTANAYTVGQNYKLQVMTAHQALSRAGYPAHVVHEDLLADGILKNYKTLVIIGQTFDPPIDAKLAIASFAAGGGTVIVDKSTTVKFGKALVTDADLADLGYRWGARFSQTEEDGKTPVEKGLYQTNYWADGFARAAAPGLKATMQKTQSKPVTTTDSVFLASERHVGGQGEFHLVINTYEKLPELGNDGSYHIYNYAPYEETFTLSRVSRKDVVYRIEGLDWQTVARLDDPAAPQSLVFEPGEMKLFLVAPREPKGIALEADYREGRLSIEAALKRSRGMVPGTGRLKTPWPLKVEIEGPEASPVLSVFRATDSEGVYAETLPLGANAAPGEYAVTVSSPVGDLSARAVVSVVTTALAPTPVEGPVRVFDKAAIESFLKGKPVLTIAVGTEEHKDAADQLASDLKEKGLNATVKPEAEVWKRARYPRVWDPYIKVHSPTEEDQPLGETMVMNKETKEMEPVKEEVKVRLTIESRSYDSPTVLGEDGMSHEGEWWAHGNLVTVVGSGFINTRGPETFYEAGCKLYINALNKLVMVNGKDSLVKTTAEVRERWSRPWSKLGSFVGAFNLIPQLPEAYSVDSHLILLGDSKSGELVRALQASELLPQVVYEKYPGPGKALVSFAWSPFALEKNVILVGATDTEGLHRGIQALLKLVP